ncbi:DUF3391 domain-containing protein [Marinobacter guineae]|uniref:DUF3391 domain-containing protein n=1 Tax=Marinobacter guineae TaxID=432303 RepID=UPI001D170447|nr:DUF3391 domain-containing protein [Marinobacter guineae]
MWFRRKSSKPALKSTSSASTFPDNARSRVSTLQRVRLPVDLLKPGMRIVSLDRPWTQVPVLFQGFTLTDDAEAQILRQYCEWVLVEEVTRQIEAGNDLNLQGARPIIRECVESIKSNPSAMFWMSRIKSRGAS